MLRIKSNEKISALNFYMPVLVKYKWFYVSVKMIKKFSGGI